MEISQSYELMVGGKMEGGNGIREDNLKKKYNTKGKDQNLCYPGTKATAHGKATEDA